MSKVSGDQTQHHVKVIEMFIGGWPTGQWAKVFNAGQKRFLFLYASHRIRKKPRIGGSEESKSSFNSK